MNVTLVEARLNRGLSTQAAAEEIGVSRAMLEDAEAGRRRPQPRKAKAIADFYEMQVTDIWPVGLPSEEAA